MNVALQNFNSFLQSAPLWMKWATLFWVFLTFLLILAAVYIKLFGVSKLAAGATASPQSVTLSSALSHYEAAHYDQYLLSCEKYTGQSNISTVESRLCEAISEARRHLSALVLVRDKLLVSPREWERPAIVSVTAIEGYLDTDFREVDYGVQKVNFATLLQDLTSRLEIIQKIASLSEYEKWLILTDMTIDDLIFAFGFVEWFLAHEAKEKLTPAQFYQAGPFMSKPFTEDEYLNSALKYFVSTTDGSIYKYVDVIGDLD